MPEDKSDDSTNNTPGVEKNKIYTISKWQKASVRLTQIKFDLENLLDKEFDEFDRKDERYEQIFESMEIMFKNICQHHRPKRMTDWVSVKNALIALGVAAIATIASNFESICLFIMNLFK